MKLETFLLFLEGSRVKCLSIADASIVFAFEHKTFTTCYVYEAEPWESTSGICKRVQKAYWKWAKSLDKIEAA